MGKFDLIKTSFGRRKIVVYTTCDEWGNVYHIKTSFGRCKIVVYMTCDEWENFGHIKTSFGRRKIVIYTTCGKILVIERRHLDVIK